MQVLLVQQACPLPPHAWHSGWEYDMLQNVPIPEQLYEPYEKQHSWPTKPHLDGMNDDDICSQSDDEPPGQDSPNAEGTCPKYASPESL